MQLSNLEHLPGYQITERLDVVYGSTVRSKHVGKDLFAGLKNIVGGELTAYTELLEDSRQEAIDRMVIKAEALNADAIVGLRFSTSSIAQGASELFVYGTAVKAIPAQQHQAPQSPDKYDNNGNNDNHTGYQLPSQSSEPSTQAPSDDLPRFNPFG
ncbi:YbjQ family protein [Psychrobacter sp.]|uniref:YbjQ family protein n=1 Tax=Psychrobacter sp. TaxID=56811 RepID=UPI0026472B7A|nr:YbjQ family protein [Psychrobacter sp.]MDN6275033.1 YbjQ family protein [Psychrobacter sp.]MDN6307837.1 YbjQ family protein [Psychrobacter sp.]